MKVSLSQTDSEWSLDPRRGFTIKKTKINLRGDILYFCTGRLEVINGKHVDIPHTTNGIDTFGRDFLSGTCQMMFGK